MGAKDDDPEHITQETSDYTLALWAEGVKKSHAGRLYDDLAFVADWGFELEQIKIPLLVVHGDKDTTVFPAHSRWLASTIKAAELRILPDTLIYR